MSNFVQFWKNYEVIYGFVAQQILFNFIKKLCFCVINRFSMEMTLSESVTLSLVFWKCVIFDNNVKQVILDMRIINVNYTMLTIKY